MFNYFFIAIQILFFPFLVEDHIPHLGDRYQLIDMDTYEHTIVRQSDINPMRDDEQGGHIRSLLSMKNSIAVQTSNDNWIEDFYLPEMMCTESQGQLILFKSKAGMDSYIHFNKNQFKLARNSQVLFKNVNGKWKSVNVDVGNF